MTEKNTEPEKKPERRGDAADNVISENAQPQDASVSENSKKSQSKAKPKKKRNLWAVKITVVTLFLSAFISLLSELTSSADNIIVTVVLLLFLITASVLFDGIGVAVTSCDITPIVSMASKKVYGAKTAMWLVKNNEKVANVCNDVIGDIFGIISGACGAAIVVKLMMVLDESWQRWLTIGMSSIISALTIGGKAFLKNIAISNSKEFVMFVARIIGVFHPEERRRKKKQAEKKRKYEEMAKKAAADGGAVRVQDARDGAKRNKSREKRENGEPAAHSAKVTGASIRPSKIRVEVSGSEAAVVPAEQISGSGRAESGSSDNDSKAEQEK